jgi:hypothetical protein
MADVQLKIYKTTLPGNFADPRDAISYAVLPGYNTPYGYTEATIEDMVQNASPENQTRIVNDLKNGFGVPVSDFASAVNYINTGSSPYTTDPKTGNLIQKSSLEQMNSLANDPNMTNIGTADRPLYVPKGSPGELLSKDPTAYNQQYGAPALSGSFGSSTQAGSAVSESGTGAGSTGESGGGFAEALNQVWLRRPDLQAVYNADGTKKNPNDGNPASLLDWAKTFGVKEETTLASSIKGFGQPQGSPGSAGSTGNPVYDQLLTELQGYLDKLSEKGKVLNPNVEITPEKLAEFTKIAENEINPYYSSQLKLAREGLMSSFGYSKDELLRTEQKLEQDYGKGVRDIGENSAEQGFALSGRRVQSENQLAQDTNSTLDANRRQLQFNASNAARTFAQANGTSELPSLTLGAAPRALSGGGFEKPNTPDSPFYSLSPEVYTGLVGTNEYQRRTDISNRSSQLEEAFRTQQQNQQQRQLTL